MARPGKILGFTGLGIALVILLALCGFGYFKYLWFEELTEFSGMEDVRTIKASVLRGGAGASW